MQTSDTKTIDRLQYKRDQESPSSTLINGSTNNRSTTPARGYLKQQKSIDSSYFQREKEQEEAYLNEQIKEDDYLDHDGTPESYLDDIVDEHKAINRESPASVIHMDRYDEDEEGLRRGSSQLTVVDSYHPMRDVYGRKPSAVDSRRTSEVIQNEDDYVETDEVRDDDKHPAGEDYIVQGPVEEKDLEQKQESFDHEEPVQPARPPITAQQRWLWAYNKIIMQLNVSTSCTDFII